jgi:hypothetical protein
MRLTITRPSHATVVSYLALSIAMGGSAYAVTGGTFVLGHANSANQVTALTNTGGGPALKLTTRNGGTAALSVSNHARVANLNADLLDGRDSSKFQAKLPTRLHFTNLTMINDWKGNCGGNGGPAIALDPVGVVHFRGTMCNQTSTTTNPFTIPAKFRPTKPLFVVVAECNAAIGRMLITPSGTVTVQNAENLANASNTAQCLTSLSGVTYTLPY